MGNTVHGMLGSHLWKEDEPDWSEPTKYDPQFGFKTPRSERPITAKLEEMDSANLGYTVRDHCSHLRVWYRGCIRYEFPFLNRCTGYFNELHDCYYGERMQDMKEFEREKRLNARERRIREKESMTR